MATAAITMSRRRERPALAESKFAIRAMGQSSSMLGMVRARVSTGTSWEERFGYCRAIRAGNWVCVSGTAPLELDGSTHAPGDMYAQTRRCLQIALAALRDLGAGPEHVMRTRMFVTDIARSEEAGRAHGEVFAAAPPVTSMVEVRALIAKDMLVEVEVDAFVE
jgi:enamine deaminase RidA (YjgF/YER057c/UK114 family)